MEAIRPCRRLEDRTDGRNQIGHFDCAGNLSAARNRLGNVPWAAPDCGILDRRDGLYADSAVMLGQLGNFVIPPLFKSIFFSLFVFTIGFKSGPEFFASLSIRTLTQVGM